MRFFSIIIAGIYQVFHVWKLTFLLPLIYQLVYEVTHFACSKAVIIDDSFADELRDRKTHLNPFICPQTLLFPDTIK